MIGFLIACCIYLIGYYIHRACNTRETTRLIAVLKDTNDDNIPNLLDSQTSRFQYYHEVQLVEVITWRYRRKLKSAYELRRYSPYDDD